MKIYRKRGNKLNQIEKVSPSILAIAIAEMNRLNLNSLDMAVGSLTYRFIRS
jgi:hypothetical protein